MSTYRMTLAIVQRKAAAVAKMYGLPSYLWNQVGALGVETEMGVTRVYQIDNPAGGQHSLHAGDLNSAYAFLEGMMKAWEMTHA